MILEDGIFEGIDESAETSVDLNAGQETAEVLCGVKSNVGEVFALLRGSEPNNGTQRSPRFQKVRQKKTHKRRRSRGGDRWS